MMRNADKDLSVFLRHSDIRADGESGAAPDSRRQLEFRDWGGTREKIRER